MSIKQSDAVAFLEGLAGPLNIGNLIESLRSCDEISQVDLAKKMKISPSHLCDIEKGRKTVSAERAAKFARVLGFPENLFVKLALQQMLDQAGLKLKVELVAG